MKYFYEEEVDTYIYYRIPKPLFSNDKYKKMLPLAKVLYGMFLDRTTLSRVNGWVDDKRRVFFYFKRTEVASMLNITEKTATTLYKELEKYELLEIVPQGKNMPNILYLGQYELST